MDFQEWTIQAKQVKSLCWQNEQLVDWVGGGSRYDLDGTSQKVDPIFSSRFDSAIVSGSGNFVILYERCGMRGVILKEGKFHKGIDRSLHSTPPYYHASLYEYPLTFIHLPNGHEGIIHCPNEYNQLEIDDLVTGERLTAIPERNPVDIFYSRLSTNASHTMFMSTGWYWHSWDVCNIYMISQVLSDSYTLDTSGKTVTHAEVGSATFLDDATIVVASTDEPCRDEDDLDPLCQSGPNSLAVYDLNIEQYRVVTCVGEPIGSILPIGMHHVLSLYNHPKLIEISTGRIVHRWKELYSGVQQSSIIAGKSPPPMALDRKHNRFAIAQDEGIRVIEIKRKG